MITRWCCHMANDYGSSIIRQYYRHTNNHQAQIPLPPHHPPPSSVVTVTMLSEYSANTHRYILFGWTYRIVLAILTTISSYSQLASAMASRVEIVEHNMKEGCWIVKRGRWSGRQQFNGYQSDWRCVSEEYCWSGKTGGLKAHHLHRGSSGWLAIGARGLDDERIVSIYLEKSVVRISS